MCDVILWQSQNRCAFGGSVVNAVTAAVRADEGAKLYPPFYLLPTLVDQFQGVVESVESKCGPSETQVCSRLRGCGVAFAQQDGDNKILLLRSCREVECYVK